MQKLVTCLWFDDQAEAAAKFYTEVFKDGKINSTTKYPGGGEEITHKPAGSVMTVSFTIAGQEFVGLNGGPDFKFNESVSFQVMCEDQAEIDYYWDKLSAVPKSEICGWCKDQFGVSWQIIPKNMPELISTPKAMKTMLKMSKIDIAALQAAK